MVDLQTAMAAAAADRQKRLDKTAADRKKRRSGADLGIERFDPVNHVAKEKAETASMWFVLAYAVVVSLLNRHMLMGWGDGRHATLAADERVPGVPRPRETRIPRARRTGKLSTCDVECEWPAPRLSG